MTTHELIATLRQGAPVTARLVREIIAKLERLDWAERSLKAALEKYGAESVRLTRDECGYVCEALEESERLKEAVRWEIECADGFSENGWGFWLEDDASEELCATYNAAWREVEGLL